MKTLKNVLKLLIAEAFVTDARLAHSVYVSITNIAKQFSDDPDFFYESCEKDSEGRCVAFPGSMLQIPEMQNVKVLIWYWATRKRADDKLMYFDAKDERDDVPESEREYELQVGYLKVPEHLKKDADQLNFWLAKNLSRELSLYTVRDTIFHEIAHLVNLRKQKTSTSSMLWGKSTPESNETETYPNIFANVMGGLHHQFADHPEKFLKKHPDPHSVADFIKDAVDKRQIGDHSPIKSEKDLMKIAYKIWKDLSRI